MPLKSKIHRTKIPPQDGPFSVVDNDGDLLSMENVDEWCKDPHPQDGPFFIVYHDGDLPSMGHVDEWCKEAEPIQLKFVHTTLTKSDDILALAKRFDGWDNAILYSLEPVIFYDTDYERLAILQYGHLDEPTFIDATAKTWVPGEDVEVWADGTVDEKALMGAFQAWRLEEEEKWRLGRVDWAEKQLAEALVLRRENAGKLWEELKRLELEEADGWSAEENG